MCACVLASRHKCKNNSFRYLSTKVFCFAAYGIAGPKLPSNRTVYSNRLTVYDTFVECVVTTVRDSFNTDEEDDGNYGGNSYGDDNRVSANMNLVLTSPPNALEAHCQQ